MVKYAGFEDYGIGGGKHAGRALHKGAVNRREAARAAKHAKQVKLEKAAKAKAAAARKGKK